ncbi:MAG: NUDIX hydrolase [Firmicutes bacterium]|nr:NUDIX hydrolase [Bacillota bacterium]
MVFEEKTLSSEMIYEGKIINLKKDKVTVVNGTSYRELIEHSGGAVLVAITGNNKMLMIRQFRKAADKVMFEAPAGKIDPDEDPIVTAGRELKEETGYTAGNIRYLCKFYTSVGYSNELLYLYLCTDLKPGETDFDENEAIDTEEWDVDELHRMVMDGELDDAKTIIAVEFAYNYLKSYS